MLAYYFFIFTVFFIGMLNVFLLKNNRQYYALSLLLYSFIIVLLGLRYQTGLDWLFYHNLYQGESFTLAIEPGYYAFSYAFSLFMNYWIYQALVTAILTICLSVFFKRNTKYYLFCVSLFYLYQFIFVSEALRQILGLSFVLVAFVNYFKKKYVLFYSLCSVAILFHVSAAIVFVMLPFISGGRVRILKFLTLVGVAFAIGGIYPIDYIIKLVSMLPAGGYVEKLLWYGQDDYAGSILTFSLIFKIIIVLMFENRLNSIKYKINNDASLMKYNVIYVALYFMLTIDIYLGRYGTISTRLDVYFIPFFLISLAYLLGEFKQGASRFCFYAILMTYFSINYYNIMGGYYFDNFFSPYQNYLLELFHPGNYSDREADVKFYLSNKESLQ